MHVGEGGREEGGGCLWVSCVCVFANVCVHKKIFCHSRDRKEIFHISKDTNKVLSLESSLFSPREEQRARGRGVVTCLYIPCVYMLESIHNSRIITRVACDPQSITEYLKKLKLLFLGLKAKPFIS